ncbi:hypothetical protein H6798_00920 [Candidatus Nomurabacteria bacterium]|nr:hypothetical protein [Candidatus Nomurabacteria bacterium]
MTIRFDRPLREGDYTAQIRFIPSVSFTSQTTAQNITVTLLENLKHDTEYTIEVGPDIFDQTDRPMRGIYQKTIQTAQPSYAYLERNYGIDYSDESFLSQDADDYIKIARLGDDPEIVFSNPEITMFAANCDFVVIATKGEERDSLYTINLQTKEVREEQLLLGGRLNYLTLSPRGKIALFTVTPDYNSVSPEYYERFSARVEAINLESGEARSLTNSEGDYIRAYSIQMDNDGQVALIQDQMQTFYAVSPFNDYDPVLIGSHTSSFGFNENGSRILFRDQSNFSLYDVSSGDVSPFELDTAGYVQSVVSGNKKIYIASTSYSLGEAQSFVYSLQGWDDQEPKIELTTSDYPSETLRELAPSYDGILLSAQLNADYCQFDQVSPNAQCEQTHTIIYDSESKKSIADFSGFGLVWLP